MASDDEAAPAAFDEEDATRLAKKMKVDELRAALEAAGADTEGTKPALVERLVAAQRAAASPQPMDVEDDAAEYLAHEDDALVDELLRDPEIQRAIAPSPPQVVEAPPPPPRMLAQQRSPNSRLSIVMSASSACPTLCAWVLSTCNRAHLAQWESSKLKLSPPNHRRGR